MSAGSSKTQVVELTFDGGMDQRAHPRQLQAPAVLSASNVRFPKLGGVEKRQGLTRVGNSFFNGSTMVAGQGRLIAFRDELLVTDGYRIGTLTEAAGLTRFIDKGKVPEAVSVARAVDTTDYFVSQPDVAYNSQGLVFHIWASNDRTSKVDGIPRFDLFWTVADVNRNAEVVSNGNTVGNFDFWSPHIVAVGANVMMAWRNAAGTSIIAQFWDPTNLVFGAPVALITGVNQISDFSMCTDGTDVFLAYQKGSNTVTVNRHNPANGALIATIDSTENLSPTIAFGFGICANAGERVWVTYSRITSPISTVTVRAVCFSPTLSAETTAPFTVYSASNTAYGLTAPCRLSATTAVVLLSIVSTRFGTHADSSTDFLSAPVVSSAGGIVGNATAVNRAAYWAVPGSKPFVASTSPLRVYAWAYVGGAFLGTDLPPSPPTQPLQWTYMLLDLGCDDTAATDWIARPITWQAPRFALTDTSHAIIDGASRTLYASGSAVALPGNTWLADAIVRRNAASRIGLNEMRATFGGPNRFITAELGRTLLMTPGFFYDRSKLCEISFAYWPQRIGAVIPSGTGGTMSCGKVYAYSVMFEDVDGSGGVHRSEPSEPVFVTIPGTVGTFTGSVSFDAPCLTITQRQGPRDIDAATGVRIVVYRAGPIDVDSFNYYRVFSDDRTPQNKTRLPKITITDTVADRGAIAAGSVPASATEVQRDTLYTLGDIRPNVMPAGFTACATYHNRVWIAYGNTVSYSKAFVTGEAVSFTDVFELPLEESGDITALWTMDDALYISTRDRIYALQGDGPTDAGTLSDFGTPSRVATDLGVIDQRSIVITPMGTIYQSAVGIQLMSRARQVDPEPIGARVRNELARFPEITSAIMHPSGRYVTFTARDPTFSGGAYGGAKLVFDYATNRWSKDALVSPITDFGQGAISEAVSRGVVYSLISQLGGNVVFAESATSNLDDGSWVSMQVDLAEIHPVGLQGDVAFVGWQFSNERLTDHDLQLTWRKDFSATVLENRTITSDKISASPAPLEQFSQNLAVHKAQSMRLTMADAAPSGPGAVVGSGKGATFIGLTVAIDPISNAAIKLPAARKS